MCRLLGFVADRITPVRDLLGDDDFAEFTQLAAVHGDGWGMAWRDEAEGGLRRRFSPVSAGDDPGYAQCSNAALGRLGVLHLRWATDGLTVRAANTHPFLDVDLALAHNGNISPRGRLEGMLSRRARAALRGDTDSERYFQFMLDQVLRLGTDAGIESGARALAVAFPQASLNAVLLTGEAMYAIHVNSRAVSPLEELRGMFPGDQSMPRGHVDQYFDMVYRQLPHSVQVASSGLPAKGWTPVPADTVMKVDLSTRSVTWW